MNDSQDRLYYKIGEVCELTGTQPYVLRFWESEFPTLAPEKNRSGQRVYRKRDVDLIERIKALLYEKEYTIAGARKVLESEDDLGQGSNDDVPNRASASGRGAPPLASPRGGAGTGKKTSRTPPRDDDAGAHHEPGLPFRSAAASSHDPNLEAENKNLRAKLAVVESELKAILADMDRHDES